MQNERKTHETPPCIKNYKKNYIIILQQGIGSYVWNVFFKDISFKAFLSH